LVFEEQCKGLTRFLKILSIVSDSVRKVKLLTCPKSVYVPIFFIVSFVERSWRFGEDCFKFELREARDK